MGGGSRANITLEDICLGEDLHGLLTMGGYSFYEERGGICANLQGSERCVLKSESQVSGSYFCATRTRTLAQDLLELWIQSLL